MADTRVARIPQRHPQVAARVVEAQGVIIYSDSGDVNVLNEVGTRIWELIDGKRSPDEIVAALVDEYAVTREVAAQDVDEFLQALAKRAAIVFAD